ncbi:MAG: nuclear transport factor 2 family protein [Actinomycetota bacterium]|nr:nuclear transport factor 2 family protein [Actinomycetota bacterium]
MASDNDIVGPRAPSPESIILRLRQVVEDWVLFRDAGNWEAFASVWHADGWMTATWFQGHYQDFIQASRDGFENGVQISHFLGGSTFEVAGSRAIAQTKMKIEQRAEVDGLELDVTCSGRFYDFLELREGRWAIVRRQPIYERDRLDLLNPAAMLHLDRDRLDSYPSGYRYLAYVQESTGHSVMRGLPGLVGPAVERLYEEGARWLGGSIEPGERVANRTQAAHQ